MGRKRLKYLVLVVVLSSFSTLIQGPGLPVWADAAPPARPPGASVSPGEFVTQVQMVSEEVLLVVEASPSPPENARSGVAAGQMIGRVEAVFVMRNQGETEESFDVWFPLGAPDGYSDVNEVENFRAWVDEVPAQITVEQRPGQWESTVPWATWPATFPPGQTVTLRVTYDVRPDGYSPYGTFPYVLETGAGWWGPIGEGTVTFRLPYEVNATNTVFPPDAYGNERGDELPKSADFVVSGTDVIWHFTDLEPTPQDNIRLKVLAPSVWEEIMAARQAAAANPDAVEAQLRLARALDGALSFKYGLDLIGDSAALAKETEAAYLRALELAPEAVEVYVEYLEWLRLLTPPLGPLPGNMRPTLEQALELAPTDARLIEIRDWFAQMEAEIATPTPEPVAAATATAAPTATDPPTAAPTATPEPTVTNTPSPTPAPTETSPPPTATATPESGENGGICPGAALVALAPLSGITFGSLLKRRQGTKRGKE